MALKLKKTPGWPAGGYPFKDPRTGKSFAGMSGDLDLQARNVIVHRRANPRFYFPVETHWFEPANVRQEIVAYMCRLRPELCVDGEAKPLVETFSAQTISAPCPKCGATEYDPVLCKSCSGGRITGYRCKKCGSERSR